MSKNNYPDKAKHQQQPSKTTIPSTTIPEEMSINAYNHIQEYLNTRTSLTKEELNAVLRLSQHLRVFGLLSAVGYINQSNAQEGAVRERTVPVWRSLLCQLIDSSLPANELMRTIKNMAQQQPNDYMQLWRKSLTISKHWNFWARAHYTEQ